MWRRMWKKGWSWRAGQDTLERENEKKLICDLVVAMRIRVLLSARPRDEQEEADEYSRDSTQCGQVSTIRGVGAGVCGAFAQSQQRTVAQASAEDREPTAATDPQAPVGAGDSIGVAGEPGGSAMGDKDGG